MRHLGERLSALIDGELSDAQRDRVLSHLARCEPCREEAAALRLIKRRMNALGDATAAGALNWRLIALAASGEPAAGNPVPGRPGWGWRPPRARVARPLLLAGGAAVAAAGLSLSAAFLAGGNPPPRGPRVVPALDVFMVQHAITTGDVPVRQAPASRVP
jgi:anti-sigma factor RsiW